MAKEPEIIVTEETRSIVQSYLEKLHKRQEKKKVSKKEKSKNYEYNPLNPGNK